MDLGPSWRSDVNADMEVSLAAKQRRRVHARSDLIISANLVGIGAIPFSWAPCEIEHPVGLRKVDHLCKGSWLTGHELWIGCFHLIVGRTIKTSTMMLMHALDRDALAHGEQHARLCPM